jgi:integrative and conjugative element protein (TIGR02256 family)
VRITLPEVIERQLTSALSRAGRKECGGVLLGEHLGVNHFAVREVTIQRAGTIASFMRDVRSVMGALAQFFKRTNRDFQRYNYLGEWHSHPMFSVQPSTTDHESMRQIATDREVGANFVVLLVVRLGDFGVLEGSAHCYLPDGSISAATLELGRARSFELA